jgi:hypothetical protein
MTQYHANSRPDMEAQFSNEGDSMRRAGFSEPRFSDEPEERRLSFSDAVVTPVVELPTAYDAAADAGRSLFEELEG